MAKNVPLYVGSHLRRLRQGKQLTQADLAHKLGISASYLNLIENHKRRISLSLLIKLSQIFSLQLDDWLTDADHHLYQHTMQLFSDDLFEDIDITSFDIRDFVSQVPHIAEAVNRLYKAYHGAREHNNDEQQSNNAYSMTALQHDFVTEFLEKKKNYFPTLEDEAVRILGLLNSERPRNSVLIAYLQQYHNISYVEEEATGQNTHTRYFDFKRQIFVVSSQTNAATKHFQLAYAVATLAGKEAIKHLLDDEDFAQQEIYNLMQVTFTNYLAAAILMPYDDFIQAVQETRYDIELLMLRYRVSFEQVCQRFTTLNNPEPNKKGIPFHFIRVDRAGNISKRFSLSGLSIPRVGSVCPRWNIFESFTRAGDITVGTAILPNNISFLTIASTIYKGERGHSSKRLMMAVGIGCDIKYAPQLVYSDRLNLENQQEFNPIGITCNVCDRNNCPDRIAFYHKKQSLINPYIKGISSYEK